MIKKLKSMSRKSKVGVAFGVFLFFAILTPSAENNNQNNKTFDSESSQQTQQVIDATEKQPIVITETKTETTKKQVPYESLTKNDSNLEKGRSVKSVAGVTGEQTILYNVTYRDGMEVDRQEVSNILSLAPVDEITLIGTKTVYVAPVPVYSAPQQSGNCDPNYTPCVPQSSLDLNCGDIRTMVRVIGSDRHRFDRDNDGYGCESYN